MRIVWRLSKVPEVSVMDDNLFLFKFATRRDKQRVLGGAPWSFDRQLLAFRYYDCNLRAVDYVFNRASFWIRTEWGRWLRIRVEIDITKPLRRFFTLAEIESNNTVGDQGDGVKQYGKWLRASPIGKEATCHMPRALERLGGNRVLKLLWSLVNNVVASQQHQERCSGNDDRNHWKATGSSGEVTARKLCFENKENPGGNHGWEDQAGF
ncbi:hypothetical protein CRYUN_Cryun03dG0110700 [Craigia yunnanensis]